MSWASEDRWLEEGSPLLASRKVLLLCCLSKIENAQGSRCQCVESTDIHRFTDPVRAAAEVCIVKHRQLIGFSRPTSLELRLRFCQNHSCRSCRFHLVSMVMTLGQDVSHWEGSGAQRCCKPHSGSPDQHCTTQDLIECTLLGTAVFSRMHNKSNSIHSLTTGLPGLPSIGRIWWSSFF